MHWAIIGGLPLIWFLGRPSCWRRRDGFLFCPWRKFSFRIFMPEKACLNPRQTEKNDNPSRFVRHESFAGKSHPEELLRPPPNHLNTAVRQYSTALRLPIPS